MSSVLDKLCDEFPSLATAPAIGAAVISNQGLAYQEVSGLRQRGSDSPAEIGDAWHLGSCTKLFTGMLLGRLIEAGLCTWDTMIDSVFGHDTETDPAWSKISLEDVLCHRAGARRDLAARAMLKYWNDDRTVLDQRNELARELISRPPVRAGRYSYSNLGYVLLGAVVDELTASTYEATIRARIFGPLSISSAGYGAPAELWGHGSRLRMGILQIGLGRPMDPTGRHSDNPAVYSSAGTLHMNLGDVIKFASSLLSRDDQFLSDDTRIRVLESVCDLSSYPQEPPVSKPSGTSEDADVVQSEYYELVGSNTLWTTVMAIEPRRHRAAIVLTNDGRLPVVAASSLAARKLLAE